MILLSTSGVDIDTLTSEEEMKIIRKEVHVFGTTNCVFVDRNDTKEAPPN